MMGTEHTFQGAEEEQLKLAKQVSNIDSPMVGSKYIIGVDVAYQDTNAFACAVVQDGESMEIVEIEKRKSICDVPYRSGFFYLREAPLIIEILKELKHQGPVLIDGNGILHPRRMGLASYVGVKMNIPTIGVAKKLMLGIVGTRKDNVAPIINDSEQLGVAFWSTKGRRPVYVSIGHRISLKTAIGIVGKVSQHRIPEPLRQAHLGSQDMRKTFTFHEKE
ncbi:MAG: endonuclease V [Candidatus Thorarchaeota archaeon]